MYRFYTILLAAALLISLSACTPREAEVQTSASISSIHDPVAGDAELAELASGNSTFAFNLYRALSHNDDNIFLSPYSISAALAMTYAGAEGVTEEEMAEVLEFSLPNELLHSSFNLLDHRLTAVAEADSTFSLHIVNALWGQTGHSFLPEFIQTLSVNYGAGISQLDFSSDPESCREAINEWVMEQTEDRIENLIPGGILSTATKLVLTNAIYFKAQWFFQFDEMGTAERPFHLIGGELVNVSMMSQTEHFQAASGEGYRAIELPYSNGTMSMLVIIPDIDRFTEIENHLGNDLLDEIDAGLTDGNLYLNMPKFKTESAFQLEDVLSGMGMPSAFGMSADFTGMDSSGTLYIASVIHKAFIALDENGTEAAAATAVIMEKMNGEACREFLINSPFIYLIRDRSTGTILFIGRVLNPLE